MANKLTQLGHPARKRIQLYLQDHPNLFHREPQRRLAYADDVIAISGDTGVALAAALYHVDIGAADLLERFNAMIRTYGYEQALNRPADRCAEAHLWMTLTAIHFRYVQDGQPPRHRHPHPRHVHVWVYEIDGHNRPKEDSPCHNCRQWVRREFVTVNGTARTVEG